MKFKVLFLLGFVVLLTGCSFNFGTNKLSMLRIPDVSGMSLEDAVSILELNGFDYNKVELIVDDSYEDGLVVKTSPSTGEEIKEDSFITLYVSSNYVYEVEDFIGKNYLIVKEQLEELGLIVELIETTDSIAYEEDTIIGQEPEVGTFLNYGDKVILYIQK